MKLEAVTYRYNPEASDKKRSLGFIAQDVENMFPELVGSNADQDGKRYLALNYSGFGVLAVKAIQEQQQQISSLKKENTDLVKRIESLEKRMQQIEQSISNKAK